MGGKVGLDFFGAAVSVATEYLASYKPVQLGLGVATNLPVYSVQRAARAARRAGMKGSEGSIRSSLSAVVDVTNSILSYMGFELVSTLEDSSKPQLEPGTMPYTPEQEFGEMTLSDYEPSESEDSDDELEFSSDATVSEDSEVEDEEEVLVKEERVEEDANI